MKYILITCDTEVGELSFGLEDAFEIFIEGKINNQEVGYKLINSISLEYGAIVEYFVDVYACNKYGEDKFKKLCQEIIDSGQKIGLHTHPSGMFDRSRKFMWEYSLDEQIEIIKSGKEKLRNWTGICEFSHRAGGYGANDNTLIALAKNEIFTDSSFFFRNPNCKINYPLINKCSKLNDVFEIPVTVYKKEINYKLVKKQNVIFQKLDFRYGSSANEISFVIDKMPEESVIVLFLHSFNFLNLPYSFKKHKYGKITINYDLINEYKKLLSFISQKDNCLFSCIKDISQSLNNVEYLVNISQKGSLLGVLKNKTGSIFNFEGRV
jgi:hypothetical protein